MEFGSLGKQSKAQRKGDPYEPGRPLGLPYALYIYLPLLETFRVTMVDFVNPPLVPLMLKVNVPEGVCLVVETVTAVVPLPVIEVGLNVAVVFAGKPLTLKVTTPLNPFCGVTVARYDVLDPFLTVCLAGDGYMVKLDIVSVTDVLVVILPLVAVMVMT